MSIIAYKIAKQIEESKNLLQISDMSVRDICSLVGFNDEAYFIKLFKKKEESTPLEYRKKFK